MSTEPEKITIALSRPVTHDEKTIASLTFREATAGDACAAELVDGNLQRTLALVASMAEISLPLAKKLPLQDFHATLPRLRPSWGKRPRRVDRYYYLHRRRNSHCHKHNRAMADR